MDVTIPEEEALPTRSTCAKVVVVGGCGGGGGKDKDVVLGTCAKKMCSYFSFKHFNISM